MLCFFFCFYLTKDLIVVLVNYREDIVLTLLSQYTTALYKSVTDVKLLTKYLAKLDDAVLRCIYTESELIDNTIIERYSALQLQAGLHKTSEDVLWCCHKSQSRLGHSLNSPEPATFLHSTLIKNGPKSCLPRTVTY